MNAAALILVLVLGAAAAQEEPAPPQEEAPPSLDDLLGLDSEDDDVAAGEAARANDEELQRRLSDAEIGDVFTQALEKMGESARLLDEIFDSGLATQRAQREVLARLDELIDLAKQMSQQSAASGSSGSSGQPEQSRQEPGARPGEAQPGGQRSAGPQTGEGTEPPPGRQGEVNPVLEETETEWGHLPERIREQLQQGRNSFVSGLYRKLTEEYYRRLAED